MSRNNWLFVGGGLISSLAIAIFLAPFASQSPDGLDRVAQDLGFETKAVDPPPASQLPFAQVFDEYQVKGVPQELATSSAGAIGTLVCFGLGLGIAKAITLNKNFPKNS